jgi:hypothetical protein
MGSSRNQNQTRRNATIVIFNTIAFIVFCCVSGSVLHPVVAAVQQNSASIDEEYSYSNYLNTRELNSKKEKQEKKSKISSSKGSSKSSKGNKSNSYSRSKPKPSRNEDKHSGSKSSSASASFSSFSSSSSSGSGDDSESDPKPEKVVIEDAQNVEEGVVEDGTDVVFEGRTDFDIEVEVVVVEENENENEILRTVQLLQPHALHECMAYNSTLDLMAVYMVDCSTTAAGSDEIAEDYWEILEQGEDTFNLRHKSSQQCIPKNPENPDEHFDCSRYSATDQVIVDSFNGLVDCASGFAAAFAMDNDSNSLHLTDTDCDDDNGDEIDILFMSYSRGDSPSNEIQTVVWGEKILLDLTDVVEKNNFQFEWIIEDIDDNFTYQYPIRNDIN